MDKTQTACGLLEAMEKEQKTFFGIDKTGCGQRTLGKDGWKLSWTLET
jgi:hypothetical protein